MPPPEAGHRFGVAWPHAADCRVPINVPGSARSQLKDSKSSPAVKHDFGFAFDVVRAAGQRYPAPKRPSSEKNYPPGLPAGRDRCRFTSRFGVKA